MPNVTIEADSVFASIQAVLGNGISGETITQGQPVYLKDADRRLWLTSSVTADTASYVGIALMSVSAGQPLRVCVTDTQFQYGGDEAAGTTLYISSTTGAITSAMPTTGQFVTLLGVTYTGTGALTADDTIVTADSTHFTADEQNVSTLNLDPVMNGAYNS